MKVTRIIQYEGTEEALNRQLSGSMPDGKREGWNNDKSRGGGVSITITTLPGRFTLLRFFRTLWGMR